MPKGITFNGHHSSEIDGITDVLAYGFPIIGEMENTSQKVTGMDGEVDGGRTLNPLTFTVQFLIDGNSVTHYFEVVFAIKKWLNVKSTKQFIFDVLPDRYLMARPTSSIDPERIASYSTVEVEFTAYDPDFRALSETIKEIKQKNLYSYEGIEETKFRLTVTPKVTAEFLRIDHKESGKFLILNRPMQVGDTVIFDTARRMVTLNGQDVRRFLDVSSRYFTIDGDYTLSTNLTDVTMNIEYEERW
jgi:predicted phage tail component-like protein